MTFSYPAFLAKIAALAGGRTPEPPVTARKTEHSTSDGSATDALAAARAAADALREQAVQLPAGAARDGKADERLELLLASLWRMTDDLALIREEFRTQSGQDRAALGAPGATGAYRMEDLGGIIAQVDAVEESILSLIHI